MFGWLKSLFSAPKLGDTAANVINSAVSGIDKLFYTDEEKAENAQKAFGLWLKAQEILIHESSIRSITRRYLAVMIVGVFLFLILLAAGLFAFGISSAKDVFQCAKSIANLVFMVAIFYFGYYGTQQIIHSVKKKEDRPNDSGVPNI
jgi:hypothetical protein